MAMRWLERQKGIEKKVKRRENPAELEGQLKQEKAGRKGTMDKKGGEEVRN